MLDVALLNPCFWPEVRRGSERFARDLADGLLADGHRPRLITGYPGLRPTRTMEDGLEVIRVPRKGQGLLNLRRFEDYLAHMPLSALYLERTSNDLAHALYPTDAVVAARWARRTGRPSVFSFMGIPAHSWLGKRRMRLKLTHEAVLESDAVVALSQVAADEFRRTFGIEARVIYPGVDVEAFSPGGRRADEPTIFSAASLTAVHKRMDDLIEAFVLLRRDRPDARLLLSRPTDSALATRIQERDERIGFVEVDDRADLVREYRSAWISALPSVAEPFGLVLIESIACGTPVVARRSGGVPEIVDSDEVGVLFEGSPEELSRALLEGLQLAEDGSTAAACRARAEQFATSVCVTRYETLYTELLEARGR